MLSRRVIIRNVNGLHIKPAGMMSSIALGFPCSVYLKVRDYEVNAKSVLGILSAQVKENEEIELVCSGEQEEACLAKLVESVNNKFGME